MITRADRFWQKVNKTDDCWFWTGMKSPKGYGKFWTGKKFERAHRFSYTLNVGTIPLGMLVLHHCDNPCCVNPIHLFVGTHADNTRDKMAKGRQAKGDNSPSRLHPESRPRGEHHWSHYLPERIQRGARHWMHRHPERISYMGERHHMARLTVLQVKEIRRLYATGQYRQAILASMFGMAKVTISAIVCRRIWKSVP